MKFPCRGRSVTCPHSIWTTPSLHRPPRHFCVGAWRAKPTFDSDNPIPPQTTTAFSCRGEWCGLSAPSLDLDHPFLPLAKNTKEIHAEPAEKTFKFISRRAAEPAKKTLLRKTQLLYKPPRHFRVGAYRDTPTCALDHPFLSQATTAEVAEKTFVFRLFEFESFLT
jgi:hypothetical protein